MASGPVLTADVGILPAQNSLSCHSYHATQEFFWVRKKEDVKSGALASRVKWPRLWLWWGRWVDAESRALPPLPCIVRVEPG